MLIKELRELLATRADKTVGFILPDAREIPAAVHLTEVGLVTKHHIDCGGGVHRSQTCVIQTWLADNDPDHRVTAAKFLAILRLAEPVLTEPNLPVEIEHEEELLSQYPIVGYREEGARILFELTRKHTDCAAKDSCGLTPASAPIGGRITPDCRPSSGCC